MENPYRNIHLSNSGIRCIAQEGRKDPAKGWIEGQACLLQFDDILTAYAGIAEARIHCKAKDK